MFPHSWLTCFDLSCGSPCLSKEVSSAKKIVDSAMTFLKGYSKLAGLSLALSRPLFVFRPKIHYYHHIVLEMRSTVTQNKKPLNPLAYSCSQAEDFIGRASLLSRRVSALTTETRVVQRYLAAAYTAWKSSEQESWVLHHATSGAATAAKRHGREGLGRVRKG